MNHGLQITWKSKYDPRKFSRKKHYGAFIDTSKIPDFDLAPNHPIYDQLQSTMCTAFANGAVSELQEGVTLSKEYLFQKTLSFMGVKHSVGADPNKAFKAVKFGAIEDKDSPYKLADKGQYFVENPDNWDNKTLDPKAKEHAKSSTMTCDQAGDWFDSILVAMWQSYQKYQETKNIRDIKAVSAGLYWLTDFQFAPQGIVGNNTNAPITDGAGHNIFFRGKKTINGVTYLIVQNSYGTGVGDKGLYYFPREVVNKYVAFAETFEDEDPEHIKRLQWNLLQICFDYLMLLSKLVANGALKISGIFKK